MKQFFKIFFASLLAMAVAGFLFFIVFIGILNSFSTGLKSSLETSSKSDNTIKSKTVLKINLSESILENESSSPFLLLSDNKSGTKGLYAILESIKAAADDSKIEGIYLRADGNASGLASSQQLRDALLTFKESGKFIYAYGDAISQSAYYVASVADSIFINPLGSVELKGLVTQLTFIKGTLDRLGVQPQIFYAGKFKSATEPLRMEKMSEPNREQTASMQKDIWKVYAQAFADHAKTDAETVDQWAQSGAIQTAEDALNHKLIEGIYYTDQLEDVIKTRVGLSKKDKVRLVSVGNYKSEKTEKKSDDGKIALLIAQGEIVDKASKSYSSDPEIAADELIKSIRKIKNDDKIKSVVLRVNSPGGSALASEKILRELDLLKEEKPLVVSMGDVAASGGYYIACHADSIYALPTTITGSIGVFGILMNSQKFFNNKLGVTFDIEKNAPYADLGNPNRVMTEQEKKFIQAGVDTIYSIFKNRVAKGRNVTMDYVDSIGQGRVWTGYAALENGLVDALGGLDRAIAGASALAKLESYQIEVYPKTQSPMEQLLSMFGNTNIKQKMIAENLLKEQLGESYRWLKVFRQIQDEKNHNYMMMPFVPEFK